MPLPPTVRVKLSSEAAGAISLTPVVSQELPIRDLIEHILGVTGKDEARIAELLLRGALVSGASRFRWQGWAADRDELRGLLESFPSPEPGRAFLPSNCVRAVLGGGSRSIELPRDAASHKGIFQRESFWDALMKIAVSGAVAYAGYSYRECCDRYLRPLSLSEAERIREASRLVKYSALRAQIETVAFTHLELFATR